MNRYSTFFIVLACAVLLSCTKEKEGIVDIKLNPPHLDSASIQPSVVHLDTDRVNVIDLGNGKYQITISAVSRAFDIDGGSDISSLAFVIYSPQSTTPLSSGILARSSTSGDTARYASPVSFVMTRSDAGVITIEFQARDNTNLVSNALRKSLIVNRNNSRPQLSNLVAPDTVQRPMSDSTSFLFAVTASDSDGYGDIADVSFYLLSPPPPSGAIPMFDSGNRVLHGDELAGDGIFSRIVSVNPKNTSGPKLVVFLARDRFGAVSDSLFHTFYVVE